VRLSPSSELQILSGLMYDPGYVPCTKFVLDDVEEGMVFQLCHKSDKLAIAFRLINTAPGTPLRIRKNLQVFAMIATLSQSSVQE